MPKAPENQSADRLEQYRAKRSQDATPEPFGAARLTQGFRFVVQQHSARALHYDFRLEWNGVLLSWAVPKGPSPNPADKRLAVRTEDHPLDYVNFEGVIPEGNYGAGAVIVWDRGSYKALQGIESGLEKGKLLFQLNGYKLRGKWTLVKIKKSVKDWLLIKETDAYVDEVGTEVYPTDSVLSGRTVEALKQGVDPSVSILKKVKKFGAIESPLTFSSLRPMLAENSEPFSRANWLFEIKYDGYRIIACKDGQSVTLLSRNGHDLSDVFPEITECVGSLPYDRIVIDGEAVVHDEQGMPSFSRLQKRGRLSKRPSIKRAAIEYPASLYAFDLLEFQGFDTRRLKLEERKALLKEALPSVGPLKFSDHIEADGLTLFEHAKKLGLEGLVAKASDSSYSAGRSHLWKKLKVEQTDDFVILGYSESDANNKSFASLLVGQYDGEVMIYRGKVGSGFSSKVSKDLAGRLADLAEGVAPEGALKESGQHWLEGELVAEIRFKEVTPDGALRHPVFLRLREDKAASECQLPDLEDLQEPAAPEIEPEPKIVPFTNRDKVFWPELGISKGDLIDYYDAAGPWILPYLNERPLVMTRYPDGIHGKNFFQKDAPSYVPDWIRIETMWSDSASREVRYFIADDIESLLYIINMGTIPLHVWGSRVAALEKPDWCILDLDPKDAPFSDVITIAKEIGKLCKEIDLPAYVKTSGSTGLHILVPLGQQCTFEQCRDLGALLAQVVVSRLPEIATVIRRPDARGGKVYIDYLQNGHGRLLVAPFSARPVESAAVSMPLRWGEVNRSLSIEKFTVKNAKKRMTSWKSHPWQGLLSKKPDLVGVLQGLADVIN